MVAIDAAGRIQVWANNKQPFRLRWQLASALGVPEDRIRINPCAIGGDFGAKPVPWMCPWLIALPSVPAGGEDADDLQRGTHGRQTAPSRRHHPQEWRETGWAAVGPAHPGGLQRGGLWRVQRRADAERAAARRVGGPIAFPHFRIDTYMMYTTTSPALRIGRRANPRRCLPWSRTPI